MRVRFEGKRQRSIVQAHLHDTATGAADAIAHLERTSPQRGVDTQAVKGGGYDRIDSERAGLTANAEETSNDEA
jgi:hypothetical protein